MKIKWESNSIIQTEIEKCSKEDDSFELIANKEGLISLSNILLEMAKDEYADGYHLHLDEWSGLEKGSIEITLMRKEHTK